MTEVPSFKLIILGDSGVGKTSLAVRQCRGQFSFQMTPTVGTSHLKTIVRVANREVELKIWDTAGQEQFASLVSMYARGAQACVIVGSFVDHVSIENIDTWRERLNDAGENPPIIVAINKTDMHEGAPSTQDEIRESLGERYPNLFFVSAKTGEGVESLFASAAAEALQLEKKREKAESVDVSQTSKEGRGCC